jgi:hypothetical protein
MVHCTERSPAFQLDCARSKKFHKIPVGSAPPPYCSASAWHWGWTASVRASDPWGSWGSDARLAFPTTSYV